MTKQDLFLECKDGLTYEKQLMKWGKYHTTILSIVTDKAFGKSSTLVQKKNKIQQTQNRRKLPQYQKGHIYIANVIFNDER